MDRDTEECAGGSAFNEETVWEFLRRQRGLQRYLSALVPPQRAAALVDDAAARRYLHRAWTLNKLISEAADVLDAGQKPGVHRRERWIFDRVLGPGAETDRLLGLFLCDVLELPLAAEEWCRKVVNDVAFRRQVLHEADGR